MKTNELAKKGVFQPIEKAEMQIRLPNFENRMAEYLAYL